MNITTASSALPQTLVDALRRNAAAQARLAPAAATPSPVGAAAPAAVNRAHGPAPFASALDQALRSVSAAQQHAGAMADGFQADPNSVGLEQAMIAMQKAQIGFQSALQVRNRLVSAYTDIMNMPV